jgi:hypothetical protein
VSHQIKCCYAGELSDLIPLTWWVIRPYATIQMNHQNKCYYCSGEPSDSMLLSRWIMCMREGIMSHQTECHNIRASHQSKYYYPGESWAWVWWRPAWALRGGRGHAGIAAGQPGRISAHKQDNRNILHWEYFVTKCRYSTKYTAHV